VGRTSIRRRSGSPVYVEGADQLPTALTDADSGSEGAELTRRKAADRGLSLWRKDAAFTGRISARRKTIGKGRRPVEKVCQADF